MTKPCGIACTKAVLVIYNCPFLVAGALLLASGIWLHFDKDVVSYFKIMETTPSGPLMDSVAFTMMGLGGSVLLVGFLGCCGACCESMCLLCLYSLLLVLVIVAQISGAIIIASLKSKVIDYIGTSMQEQIKHSYNRTFNSSDALTIAWDIMQVQLDCCGGKGPQDYKDSYWFNTTQLNVIESKLDSVDRRSATNKKIVTFVPATCCILTNRDPRYPQVADQNQCQVDAVLYPDDVQFSTAVKTRGCQRALVEWLRKHKNLLIGLSVGFGILEVSGLILTCCLMASIRREQSKYPWYVSDDDE